MLLVGVAAVVCTAASGCAASSSPPPAARAATLQVAVTPSGSSADGPPIEIEDCATDSRRALPAVQQDWASVKADVAGGVARAETQFFYLDDWLANLDQVLAEVRPSKCWSRSWSELAGAASALRQDHSSRIPADLVGRTDAALAAVVRDVGA